MSTLAISLGLIAQTVLLVVPGFSKSDLPKLGLALLVGLFAAGRAEDWIFFPLGFSVTIAFIYKDKIMPVLTEGTVFLYALTSLFIFLSFDEISIPIPHFNESLFLFLLVFSAAMCVLCISKVRLPFALQVIVAVLFLVVSVYIAYHSSIMLVLSDTSLGGQFLLGFYGLHFLSYGLYILNFIPIPTSKHQSFSERWREVKQHASDLEQKYIDIDIHGWRTVSIIAVVGLLVVYAQFYTDLITGIVIALTVGSFLAAPLPTDKDAAS